MKRYFVTLTSILVLMLIGVLAIGSVSAQDAEDDLFELDPSDFDESSINIDNQWFPLQPGTQYIYEGTAIDEDEGEIIERRVITTITDLTKVINGVNTVVLWDQDFNDDELVEAEIAFFAQDKDGNVWRLGEYPEEYDEGEFADAPFWIVGLEDARAGIAMMADPQVDTPSYSQGWGPEVDFTDRGQVFAMGQETCVPTDCYEEVLITDEFNPDEPEVFQQKYYAPGVGNVRVGFRGDDPEQETLELVELVQLDPDALAEAREAALELEAHAYEISEDVYGETEPAQLRPDAEDS